MLRHVTGLVLAGSVVLSACVSGPTSAPKAIPCSGLVDVSDSATFVRYSAGQHAYWDVTLAILENPCAVPVEVVALDVLPASDLQPQGVSVVDRPDEVYAAAPARRSSLPALTPVQVGAGRKVQLIGRFEIGGTTPARVPQATLTFRNDDRTGSLTLTPRVSLCTCPPPP